MLIHQMHFPPSSLKLAIPYLALQLYFFLSDLPSMLALASLQYTHKFNPICVCHLITINFADEVLFLQLISLQFYLITIDASG